MPRDYVKENPRILFNDVCDYISTHSNLNRSQVKECFEVYYKMISEIICSDYVPKDITITFPKIGHFYFVKKNGRKKGTQYQIPKYFGSKELKTIVLEEDEPDTLRLSFKVSGTLNNKLKERNKTYE